MDNSKYINSYAKFLENSFLNINPSKPLKVVFDCSNGGTGEVLRKMASGEFRMKNVKIILINENPDGGFSAHGPNPLSKGAMDQIKKEVIKEKADLGIIFDADGDRAFFIDNKGELINSDVIGSLLIWYMQPKKVIVDVRTGWLIRKNKNLQITESKVGHYYIKNLMKEKNADFAVETSGHYYFKKFFNMDGGIVAALSVISAISNLPYSVSGFSDFIDKYYRSGEINIEIRNKENEIRISERIENYYKRKAISVSHLDGLSIENEEWRFNLRDSNTENFVRLNVEATSQQLLKEKTRELTSFFK